MQPFEGIRVIDLTHVLAGPFATYQLAVLGADVIKIENPQEPDQSRETGPDPAQNAAGMGSAYQAQGANKRTITLNLKSIEGRAILGKLIAGADVFVENYRPGAMAKLGLGPDDLLSTNPRLIYCSMSAFGHTGPRAEETAYDAVIQATSGLMRMNAPKGVPSLRLAIPTVDYSTGIMGAFAISAALFQRERSGRGQHIDLAMFDVVKILMSSNLAAFFQAGVEAESNERIVKIATRGTFAARDGEVVIAANNTRQQDRLWRAFDEAARSGRTADEKRAHYESDRQALASAVAALTCGEVEALLKRHRVPAGRVRGMAEALADIQGDSRPVIALPPGGSQKVPVTAFHLRHGGPKLRHPPRALGADTEEVLAGLGYDGAAVAALRRDGVI
jgi:crotonobetainyl-CoA:carnitine CoA-transferase CaiB-like acyl-CoA transferase